MNTIFTNKARWECPVLDENARQIYSQVYGKNGDYFFQILAYSPFEISVISRLLAYLNMKKGAECNGHAENC